jgi:Kef-type K+ transport system membrane component KefB
MKILLCIFLALGACQSDVDHADSGTLSAQDAPPGTHQAVVTTDPGHDDDGHGDSLQASGDLQILLLLALLIAAFLTTHFMVRMAGRRWFLALPGLPYLVVGLLVGPAAFEIISAENLESLQPAVTVAIGSIGLLAGLRLNFRRMWPHLEMEHVRSAAWIAVLTGVIVGIPTMLLLGWYVGAEWGDWGHAWAIVPPALLVVATALVSGTTPIQYTIERYRAKGWMSTFAVYVAEFSEVLGILVFSLVFAIANNGETFEIANYALDLRLDLVHWLIIQIVIGVVCGLLFTLFIGDSDNKEKLLVALLGIIVFSSGVAYYLRLSPLLITFFVGLVLANLSGFAERLRARMEAVEKPFFIVIFFFAGMQLMPSITWWALLLIPTYSLLRWGGKWLGGEAAFRTSRRGDHIVRGVGSALVSQGGLAVAMVLSYMQVTSITPTVGSVIFEANMAEGYLSNIQSSAPVSTTMSINLLENIADPAVGVTSIVATVIMASIIINDTFSFISTRNLLINAGEIDPDVDVVPEDIYAHPELNDDHYSGAVTPGEQSEPPSREPPA